MTEHVCAAIRAKWPAPEYGHLFEVRSGTGFATFVRTADALVMGLWPSRGLDLHGIEIKVSRGDWLRELKQPEKADAIASYCDYWSLVTDDESIARMDEIPTAWGYFALRKDTLKCVKAPERLQPAPLERSFLAAMMRAMNNQSGLAAQIKAEMDKERQAMVATFEQRVEQRVHSLHSRLQERDHAIEEFQKASGLTITGWMAGDIGAAVKAYMECGEAMDVIRQQHQRIGIALAATGRSYDRGCHGGAGPCVEPYHCIYGGIGCAKAADYKPPPAR